MTNTLGPLMEVARIQSEINRLFENLSSLGGDEAGASWMPNIDILETEETLVLRVELPGVEPAALSLSVHGGDIIIRGEKQRTETHPEQTQLEGERDFGPFRRVIHLGVPVNTRQAAATLVDGLLTVRFPKVPNRRGEEVPIEVSTR
ncbi:MAG: Hsp20/alpha crystallin family protein [Acidobacteriota bacterium]|nr:Hsp20/alpha crystallin family protein [Acidobacteriota bacterium]MDH3783851.1 Hsp20/alpha crystallin family protein [Acidobacteriota bacterium]